MMLKWYKYTFCQEEKRIAEENSLDVYDIIIKNASKSPIGSHNIYSSLFKREWYRSKTTS